MKYVEFAGDDDDMICPDNDPHYPSRCSDPTFAAIVPLCVTLTSVHQCCAADILSSEGHLMLSLNNHQDTTDNTKLETCFIFISRVF